MTDPALYYSIGTSIATLKTFDILGVITPFQDAYKPFSVGVKAADLRTYGHGLAATALHWGFIDADQRDILKGYCPGLSADLYMVLRDEDWNWDYCHVTLLWPEEEPPPSNDFVIGLSINILVVENYGTSPP